MTPSGMNNQVLFGDNLISEPVSIIAENSRILLKGQYGNGEGGIIPMSETLFSKHLLMLGGIGTGKTNTIFQVLDQLEIKADDVVVIFDTKGDYYQRFYQKGDIVISNDDNATGKFGIDYWNIFNEISNTRSPEEDINEIVKTLFFERSKNTMQPFFPNAARDILAGVMIHLVRSNGERTNKILCDLFERASVDELRSFLDAHDDLRGLGYYIAKDSPQQAQGVLSELHQMLHEIFIGNFKKAGTISIRDSIREKGGRRVFIEYDLGIGNTLTPIYRLLLDMALKEAMSRKKSEGNVWFIIDEFRLIPHLQHIDDGINFGRSLGIKFIIGVQNVEQVFSAYGEQLARSILSGFSTMFSFRVNDVTTRTYIKEHCGQNRKYEAFPSKVGSRGLVENVRDAFVVEDWEIMNLKDGQAIVKMPTVAPFYFLFDKFN